MRRPFEEDEEWGSSEWDEDDSEPDDYTDNDEEEPTIACPYCRREIHEDSVRCPHCGQYILDEDLPPAWKWKPWWIIVGVLLCLLAIGLWIVRMP